MVSYVDTRLRKNTHEKEMLPFPSFLRMWLSASPAANCSPQDLDPDPGSEAFFKVAFRADSSNILSQLSHAEPLIDKLSYIYDRGLGS